jgi:hypothetical protein
VAIRATGSRFGWWFFWKLKAERLIGGCVAFFSLALVISVDQEGGEFIVDGNDRANRLLENSVLFTNRRELTGFGPSRNKT